MAGRPEDEIFLDEPWVTIRWDSGLGCVHTEWKAFANSAEYRAAAMKAVEAIKERKAVAYLSDTRKTKLIVHKDQEWLDAVWVPLALAAGLKRAAVVTAASGLGKMTVKEAISMVNDRGLLIHTFDSIEAAREWVAGSA